MLTKFIMLGIFLISVTYYFKRTTQMAKDKTTKSDQRPRFSIICNSREQQAMQALKNAAAGERNLSWSDFILEQFGIRKAELPQKHV